MAEDFKQIVKEFIELDDQIKEAQAELKQVRQRHKELRQQIIEYMSQNEISSCNIHDGNEQLTVTNKEKKIRPDKQAIILRMGQFLKDEKKAIDLHEFVFDQVDKEKVQGLSRKMTSKGKKRKKSLEEEE